MRKWKSTPCHSQEYKRRGWVNKSRMQFLVRTALESSWSDETCQFLDQEIMARRTMGGGVLRVYTSNQFELQIRKYINLYLYVWLLLPASAKRSLPMQNRTYTPCKNIYPMYKYLSTFMYAWMGHKQISFSVIPPSVRLSIHPTTHPASQDVWMENITSLQTVLTRCNPFFPFHGRDNIASILWFPATQLLGQWTCLKYQSNDLYSHQIWEAFPWIQTIEEEK